MNSAEDLLRENESLRSRLSKLSEASLRINESLDFDKVLQGVLDSARSLTGALHGVMVFFSDALHVQTSLLPASRKNKRHSCGAWPMGSGSSRELADSRSPCGSETSRGMYGNWACRSSPHLWR